MIYDAPPVIRVTAEILPEAWEDAVIATWNRGYPIETQYDRPGDPPSRDAIACITVRNPLAEPRIHRAMPGGIYDLELYRQEVVDGIHDHWISPEEGKWSYTYHERMRSYNIPTPSRFVSEGQIVIDQIKYVVDTLAKAPYSRRAQVSIWKVWEDTHVEDPACLQRLWFRVFEDRLVMNAHMRSNDAYKAAFMNMYAFTEVQRMVAEKLSERMGATIRVGQYTHIADSFHIYGSYYDEFEGFLKSVETRTFEQRTYRTEDMQELFDEARTEIEEKLRAE